MDPRLNSLARVAFPLAVAIAAMLSAMTVQAANTEKDVNNRSTDLVVGVSYMGGGTPGATWDVTFTNLVYCSTTFTIGGNLTLDSLNGLTTTALSITNNFANATLTLTSGNIVA